MKLGLDIGYAGARVGLPVEKVQLATRLGYDSVHLAGRKDEAVAAVPEEHCDEGALVGPAGRIRERYRAWADCGISGFIIVTEQAEALELMADLAGVRPTRTATGGRS